MVRPWCLPALESLRNGWPLYFYTIPVCVGHRLVCGSVTLQMILTEHNFKYGHTKDADIGGS